MRFIGIAATMGFIVCLSVFSRGDKVHDIQLARRLRVEYIKTVIQQRNDCGAVALYAIVRASGKPLEFEDVLSALGPPRNDEGYSMMELADELTNLGYHTEGAVGSAQVLREHMNQPQCYAILYLNSKHFVAVLRHSPEHLLLFDRQGLRIASVHALRARWSGVMLLASPKKAVAHGD